MRNGEWTLAYGGQSVTFGLVDSEATFTAAPDLGDASLFTADTDRARTDGVAFGVDFRGGRTVTFELAVSRRTEAEARDVVERLAALWRADSIRRTPGATATLTARQAGRERVMYGRPRRFAPDDTDIADGYVKILADFAVGDDCFYSPTDSSAVIALVPPPSGGLLAPLSSPLATTESSDRSIGITVSGRLPAWPVITITGPITNPVVDIVGLWRIELRTTLSDRQRVVIDTRPWVRTIKRDGASIPGVISRASPRLANASIPPGTYEVALRGLSETGSASARIAWRDTYPTL